MKELLSMFWVFARMGAVTFGGGYAMLPIIQREIVEKRKLSRLYEGMDVSNFFTSESQAPKIAPQNYLYKD